VAVGDVAAVRRQDRRGSGRDYRDRHGTLPPEIGDDRAVFVPRRDTDSRLVTLLGGRVFPGVHHHATFDVAEGDGRYAVAMRRDDGDALVRDAGERTDALPRGSVVESVADDSAFFEDGSIGYSPAERGDTSERLDLHTLEWDVTPLSLTDVGSSYFDALPEASVSFDHALLMEDVDHECHEGESLCSTPA
jgi:hypothetical protein